MKNERYIIKSAVDIDKQEIFKVYDSVPSQNQQDSSSEEQFMEDEKDKEKEEKEENKENSAMIIERNMTNETKDDQKNKIPQNEENKTKQIQKNYNLNKFEVNVNTFIIKNNYFKFKICGCLEGI